jgi:hypothetical protein
MDKDVTQQLSAIMASLRLAETQAKTLLQTAREAELSFGLDYNYVDEDIARVLGRVHYMQLIATQWADQHEGNEGNKGQLVAHAASAHR